MWKWSINRVTIPKPVLVAHTRDSSWTVPRNWEKGRQRNCRPRTFPRVRYTSSKRPCGATGLRAPRDLLVWRLCFPSRAFILDYDTNTGQRSWLTEAWNQINGTKVYVTMVETSHWILDGRYIAVWLIFLLFYYYHYCFYSNCGIAIALNTLDFLR
jgi:hypothetical protein